MAQGNGGQLTMNEDTGRHEQAQGSEEPRRDLLDDAMSGKAAPLICLLCYTNGLLCCAMVRVFDSPLLDAAAMLPEMAWIYALVRLAWSSPKG